MTKQEMVDEIERLKKRVGDLEARPPHQVYYIPYAVPQYQPPGGPGLPWYYGQTTWVNPAPHAAAPCAPNGAFGHTTVFLS